MSSSNNSHITDEMLSAFIDDVLPENEHQLIKAAIKSDAEVAWRAQSLRQTVSYLNELPELELPRSFALPANMSMTAPQVAQKVVNQPRTVQIDPVPQNAGFWSGVREFLQGGGTVSFNAMAATMAVAILLIGGGLLYGGLLTQNFRTLTDATQVTTASQSAAPKDEIARDQETASSSESETVSDEESTSGSPDTVAIVEESTQSNATTSTGSTELPEEQAAVSVASLPTAASVPAATALPTTEPAKAEFADPSITPSTPLAQPTATQLPTPEMALAQGPASASSAAASAAPAGPQSTEVQSLGVAENSVAENSAASSIANGDSGSDSVLADSAEYSSAAATSSRKIELPAASELAIVAVEADEIDEDEVATSEESNVANRATIGSLESSTIIPLSVTTNSDSADDGATSSISPVPAPTSRLVNLPVELAAALPAIVIEVDEFTGALTGTIQVRQDDGTMRPVALADIGLVRLDSASLSEDGAIEYNEPDARRTLTDNNGLFIFTEVAPSAYALFIENDGAQFRLGMPTDNDSADNSASDATLELVIEIQAGEQTDIGILEYEKLP